LQEKIFLSHYKLDTRVYTIRFQSFYFSDYKEQIIGISIQPCIIKFLSDDTKIQAGSFNVVE